MVLGVLEHETPSIFFRRILRSEALVYNSYIFFRTLVLRKLFDIRFSFKHCKFLTRLPTRQGGFENRDKVYLQKRFGYARHFEFPCRGGSRGRVQGVRTPPPEMTCGFLIQLVFCKKTMWFIGRDECTPS